MIVVFLFFKNNSIYSSIYYFIINHLIFLDEMKIHLKAYLTTPFHIKYRVLRLLSIVIQKVILQNKYSSIKYTRKLLKINM